MSPSATGTSIAVYTGLGAADFAAGPGFATPFFAGDSTVRSLNRTRLVGAPGLAPALRGRTAAELLSARVVAGLVLAAAEPLGLDPATPDLLLAFDRCFDDAAARPVAQTIAVEVGRRLAALLLTLHHGEPSDRAARPDWGDAQWAFWHSVERVVVGGGLFAGRLGRPAVPAASKFLAAAGCPVVVERSAHGGAIALAGLARHAPPDAARMLLFDFGQTSVKRGEAVYREGRLVELQLRPSLPAPEGGAPDEPIEVTQGRWATMRDLVVAGWRSLVTTGEHSRTVVGLSLATHLRDGHPFVTDHGPYSRLGLLAPHLATFMRDELAAALGPFRSFALLHDGLAAASTRAGEPRTVVLALGTAIGAGYVPVGVGLRAVRFKEDR